LTGACCWPAATAAGVIVVTADELPAPAGAITACSPVGLTGLSAHATATALMATMASI
jgi:hypothetical protein